MWDVILDAFLDSLKIFPFLILLYIIIEVVEEKVSTGTKFYKYTNGKYATLVGAGLGLIPQCGFSVVASDLYARRYIKVGTLLAIFIATSDEAIPIILSNPAKAYLIFPILLIKFVFAIFIGYLADLLLRNYYKKQPLTVEGAHSEHEHKHSHGHVHNHVNKKNKNNVTDKQENKMNVSVKAANVKNAEIVVSANQKLEHAVEHEKQHKHDNEHGEHAELDEELDGCCGHIIEAKRNTLTRFFIHPLIHSLKIFAYILIINLIMGTVIHFVGEENVVKFMQGVTWLQPIIVGLVGLIPNCASSVLITQMLLINGINFGAAVAGLCVNAGIGLAMLFKENKNIKHNIYILLALYLSAVVLGYSIMLISLLF